MNNIIIVISMTLDTVRWWTLRECLHSSRGNQ